MTNRVNQDVAGKLEEVATLLRSQGADAFRVHAYLRAAEAIRGRSESTDEVFRARGLGGLKDLPHVGESIARAVRDHRHTVITAQCGPLSGHRVVAGRQDECRAVYRLDAVSDDSFKAAAADARARRRQTPAAAATRQWSRRWGESVAS